MNLLFLFGRFVMSTLVKVVCILVLVGFGFGCSGCQLGAPIAHGAAKGLRNLASDAECILRPMVEKQDEKFLTDAAAQIVHTARLKEYRASFEVMNTPKENVVVKKRRTLGDMLAGR